MIRIEFHAAAEAEAREIAAGYEFVRPQLSEDFRKELRDALERIEKNPLMYAAEREAVRIAPLRRFPFGLIYDVELERVWILAVAHHHRRPGYWLKRRLHG